VTIEGTPVQSGFLAAFVNDECRGIAQPVYYGPSDHYIFNLTCYSDNTEGDVLVFRYYDPVSNKEYNMDRSVDFVPGMTAGTEPDPLLMNVGVDYSVSFPVGWKWFSVNTTLDNMSLEFILSSVNTPDDYIKSQESTSTYYSGYGWFGPLKKIEPGLLYKIKVQDSTTTSYTGRATDVNTLQIPVVSGWNWIGYLPQVSISLNDAFSSLSLAHLDYIKSQASTSTYYSGYGWFGELKNLTPAEGYMLKVANEGNLKYPESGKSDYAIQNTAKGDTLDFNTSDYEHSGSVTARVFIDGEPFVGTEYDRLYAYVGNEIRGITSGEIFPPTGAFLYSLLIWSNIAEGEIIHFGLYDSENDKYLLCDETVIFESDMVLKEAYNPFEMNITSVGTEDHFMEDLSLNIYPNPFESNLNIEYNLVEPAQVRISVLDIYGKVVSIIADQEQEPDNYVFTWESDLQLSGTYHLRFEVGNRQIYRKVIFMK